MRPAADPAGLLGRVPELEPLCESPSIRRAIERGDPFAVHRALFWARLFGRFPQHRETLDLLVGHRRFFAKPLTRAPALFSVNGVGASAYGRDEIGDDGAYVLT